MDLHSEIYGGDCMLDLTNTVVPLGREGEEDLYLPRGTIDAALHQLVAAGHLELNAYQHLSTVAIANVDVQALTAIGERRKRQAWVLARKCKTPEETAANDLVRASMGSLDDRSTHVLAGALHLLRDRDYSREEFLKVIGNKLDPGHQVKVAGTDFVADSAAELFARVRASHLLLLRVTPEEFKGSVLAGEL
jgi:hypothetical protein